MYTHIIYHSTVDIVYIHEVEVRTHTEAIVKIDLSKLTREITASMLATLCEIRLLYKVPPIQ